MRITKGFKINDLINYMRINDVDILKELESGETFIITDLIKISNKCSDDDAINIFLELLKTMKYEDIVKQIAFEIFPIERNENTEYINNKDKSFENILYDFYNEIQTLDERLSFTEFMNMNTETVYKYADGVKQRCIFNKNKKLRDDYDYIAMFSSALNGKLKKCPQLNADGTVHKDSLEEKIQMLKNRR